VESTATEKENIDNVAFQNVPDGSIVMVMVNSNVDARAVSVAEGQNRFEYTMPPRSVATFVWNTNQANAWTRRLLWWLHEDR
jgi:glucosylceramidase